MVRHPFQITEETLPEGFVKDDLFAVIESSGTQYKVVKVRISAAITITRAVHDGRLPTGIG
jgi:hypothetical protein